MQFAKVLVAMALGAVCAFTATAQSFLPSVLMRPIDAPADSGEVRLTFYGDNFNSNTQVLWNGEPRETVLEDAQTITGIIPAKDVRKPGMAMVSLRDGQGGALIAQPQPFYLYLRVRAKALIRDAGRKRLYASVPKLDPNGPSIAIIDPEAGVVERYIPLPGEPSALAISEDSHYLYAGVDDYVRRLDLNGIEPNLDYVVPSSVSWHGPSNYAAQILPMPGTSLLVVAFAPSATVVFDGPQMLPRDRSQMCLAGPVADPRTGPQIYSAWQSNSGTALLVAPVGPPEGIGIPQPLTPTSVLRGYGCGVRAGDRVYSTGGDVYNLSAKSLLPEFAAAGLVAPARENDRTYFVHKLRPLLDDYELLVFKDSTRQLLQSIPLSVVASSIVPWGADGVAMTGSSKFSSGGPYIYLFRVPDR